MALEYLDLSGLQHFKERQDLSNAATFATTSYVTQLVGSVTAGVYQYKGSKATVAELPSSGNRTGDVYDVAATGMNYAWDGSAWDALGTSYSAATQSAPGLMSAADKAKLDSVAAGEMCIRDRRACVFPKRWPPIRRRRSRLRCPFST